VHSNAAAQLAEQRFKIAPSKLHVIPHGHYIDAYPNEISQEDARTALDLPDDARVFLFLGRIEP
jgi:beta-1,4-mannosyltransferase